MPAAVLAVNPMNVVVRSDLPADQLIAAVRRTIRQADPTLAMENVRTIHDIVLNTLQLERLSSLVMTFFGLAALVMATLGIYGVVSYFVRQRTVELGTRMALGAVNRDLVALVLGGGLKLALVGVAVGSIALVGAVLAARAVPRGRQLRMAAVCGVHGRGRARRRGGRGGAGVAHHADLADGRHSRAAAVGLAVGASADAASPFATFARRSALTTRIGRLGGRRADGLRRRRARRRLVHRRAARRARQRVRRADASNRPRCSSGATARRWTTAASSPPARSKRPRRSWPPTDS